ncbi:hypothetical protein [Bacillus suaedae]|uniref:DUF4352 domain-containing protein n=1 Tax=Halalkalibacter suaedae TaxID=2822140 RepID=A0A941APV1_9BACI|nr:hypothetical protein [Bacillus suaedae]MBP3951912.1 hypothetical protein [Bacillus suaedae]
MVKKYGLILILTIAMTACTNEEMVEEEIMKDEKTERDWASISLFDWEKEEIRLPKEEFQDYLHWLSSREDSEIEKAEMIDHKTIDVYFSDNMDELLVDIPEELVVEPTKVYETVASIQDTHLREAYKASTYYQNQIEPTIRYYDNEDQLIVSFNQSAEVRTQEEEERKEQNRTDLGTYGFNQSVMFENFTITFTGGNNIPRRLEDEIYTPKHVVHLGVEFENTSDRKFFASVDLFTITDSWGNELDLYKFDDRLAEFVDPGQAIHGPIYFVASGKGPYELTYRTEESKATWIVEDERVGLD